MLFCTINNVKCDFVHEPAKKLLPFLLIDDVYYFSVKDNTCMKLHTVCGRGKNFFFFDIYCLLQFYDWKLMTNWFEEKYNSDQLVFLWRSIFYFADAESDPEIKGFEPFTKSWNEIKLLIKQKCN